MAYRGGGCGGYGGGRPRNPAGTGNLLSGSAESVGRVGADGTHGLRPCSAWNSGGESDPSDRWDHPSHRTHHGRRATLGNGFATSLSNGSLCPVWLAGHGSRSHWYLRCGLILGGSADA